MKPNADCINYLDISNSSEYIAIEIKFRKEVIYITEGTPIRDKNPQLPLSQIELTLPSETAKLSKSDLLSEKIKIIMEDPDLYIEIGGYINQLAVPGMVRQGKITEDQGNAIAEVGNQTLKGMVKRLSPEVQAEIEESNQHEIWAAENGRRDKISPFARR